jgi:hypothetical protein
VAEVVVSEVVSQAVASDMNFELLQVLKG